MRIITIYDGQYREVLAQLPDGRLESIITNATDALTVQIRDSIEWLDLYGLHPAASAEEVRDIWTADALAGSDEDQIAWARSVKVDIHDLSILASTDHYEEAV